ncbi:MAG: tcdA [Paucimonas sp.]|nr:tcdA [Paucimonas sp.]
MERLADSAARQLHEEIDFDRRFSGIARLYGPAGLQRFRAARLCVVGVGGVGSWVVEALARSAIGHITMIDLDNVAESNINRQLHALSDTLGMAKVSALAQRIGQINPFCEVVEVEDFLTEDNLAALLCEPGAAAQGQVVSRFDYIIDAIDNVRAKSALIAWCRQHRVPLVTIGAAGGQLDPTRIEIRDLARTEQEPLLAKVRKRLRGHYGFPRGEKSRFGIDAVFSTEPLRLPVVAEACELPAQVGATDGGSDGNSVTGLNCAGFGSTTAVTASFGMAAAARVLQRLAGL